MWLSAGGNQMVVRLRTPQSAHELGHTRSHPENPLGRKPERCSALPQASKLCRTQPHSAAICRTLPHSAALCCTLLHSAADLHSAAICCNLLQSAALGNSVAWQHTQSTVLRGPGRTIRQTQPHSAALCCTLLHSAALCCYLPPSVILGHSRAQSAVLMNTLQCRTKAPSDSTDSATLSHIECQVGRAHLGVGVRGRVWPSVAVPRLALFTLCYSQARSAALGYTLSGYAAICPPRQLGRVQLS